MAPAVFRIPCAAAPARAARATSRGLGSSASALLGVCRGHCLPSAPAVRRSRPSLRAVRADAGSGDGGGEGSSGVSIEDLKKDLRANAFSKAKEQGASDKKIVSNALNKAPGQAPTQTEMSYADKIKKKLAEDAAEAQRIEDEAREILAMGILSYERSNFDTCIKTMDVVAERVGANTKLGGEATVWKALAYDGMGEPAKALAILTDIEKNNPRKDMKKQATGLKMIIAAPKLKISKEERVEIPPLDDLDDFDKKNGFYGYRPKPKIMRKKVPKTMEEEFLENWQPGWKPPNKYALVAGIFVLCWLAWYSASAR